MKTPSLIALRRKAGLAPVSVSAAQLRASNPALADKWGKFIADNKAAISRGLVARMS